VVAGKPVEKEDYAREIPKLKEDILAFVSGHNLSDLVLALLSLEDAYDNLSNALLPMTIDPSRLPPMTTRAEQLALQDHVHLKMSLIEGGLRFALNYGRPAARTIERMPGMIVGVSGKDPDVYLEQSMSEGKIGPKDSWKIDRFRLLGYAEGSEIVVVQRAKDTPLEDLVLDTLLWLEDIYRVGFFTSAMQRNLILTRIEGRTGSYVYNPVTPDNEVLERAGEAMALHNLDPSASGITWNSDFHALSMDTVLNTMNKSLYSKENQDAMKKETGEAYKGFTSFEGFSTTFRDRFGYSVEEFRVVCQSLRRLATTKPPHSIWYGAQSRLSSQVEKETRIGRKAAGATLASLIWNKNLPPFLYPIYRCGPFVAFSLWRIMLAEQARLEFHYAHAVNNDVKGKAYERACRKVLTKRGFLVLPESLEISGEFIPPEVSMDLWGHVKRQTDIDVVGKKGNLIMVMECKEVKRPNVKMLRRIHYLEKCADELPFKARWLVANRDSELVELRAKGLAGIEVGDWIVPLVVSTFVSGYERSEVAILTYLEFERFCGLLDVIKVVEQGEVHTMEIGEAIGRSGVRTRLIQVSA
jgi:hypothetical protein